MGYTLGEAARAAGKSKATIHRAIRSGKLSAARDEVTGPWLIDPSELARAFPPVSSEQVHNGSLRQYGTADETVLLRVQLELERAERQRERAQFEDTIADLRQRLDSEAEERRRLTVLLIDQSKPRRRWWSFGRRG
jgi:hypothetical protein